jgi:hypothetical protein
MLAYYSYARKAAQTGKIECHKERRVSIKPQERTRLQKGLLSNIKEYIGRKVIIEPQKPRSLASATIRGQQATGVCLMLDLMSWHVAQMNRKEVN